MRELGWKPEDYDLLGKGQGIGHLMECGPQCTGGYFADPPFKVVPDLEHYQRFLVGKLLSLPIVKEVRSNISIETLKAGAPLPLDHLARPQTDR